MPIKMALTMREALLPTAVVTVANPLEMRVARPMSETQLLKRRASYAWITLSDERKAMWTIFAAKFRRYSAEKGKVISPSARAIFTKVALERWRLDPSLASPTEPPVSTFAGDDIGVFATPSTKKNAVPAGHLRMSTTGANSKGVMTALLVQKLSGPNRKPTPRLFKAADFVTFQDGQTEIDLPVENGYYATAYRFVDVNTLQMGPVMEGGIVAVGVKPRRKKPSAKTTPASTQPSVTHAVIDLERFAGLHHWPS